MNELSSFFVQYKSVIIILHALGAAVGLGSATVSDILFFHLLKDGKIDQKESRLLAKLTKLVWLALAMIVISGIALFLSNPELYMNSSKFIVKMLIVLILSINGLFITLFLHKKMHYISFLTKEHRTIKRIGFASGSISVLSWYTVFILGSIRSIPIKSTKGIIIYLLMLLVGVVISQVVYRHYKNHYAKDISNS